MRKRIIAAAAAALLAAACLTRTPEAARASEIHSGAPASGFETPAAAPVGDASEDTAQESPSAQEQQSEPPVILAPQEGGAETPETGAPPHSPPPGEDDGGESAPASEDPAAGRLLTGFGALLPSEAIVEDYSQLKAALSVDNGISTVYLGRSIEMQGGIRINPKKSGVTISGINPNEPGQTEPYTLTDYSSASFIDTIYIDDPGIKSLHIRDLNIIGKNYYGSFSVADAAALSGVALTYERVSYSGPQMCYHRQGTVRLHDCTATVQGGNGGSANQEFSEVKNLVFEGRCSIDTQSGGFSVFWLPLGGSFSVADDSTLTLNSPYTSALYGVFYADGAKIDLSVGSRAVFDITISGFLSRSLYAGINSLTVHEGGHFNLKTTQASEREPLKMDGAIKVERDAKFTVTGYGGASCPLLRQESGDITVGEGAVFHMTGERPYACLIELAGRGLKLNNPGSVLLFNDGRTVSAAGSPGSFDAGAQQINYWSAIVPDSLDSPALYKWEKADKTDITISGTLAAGENGNFSSLTSNHVPGDLPETPPSPSSLNMPASRILALGRFTLTLAPPAEGTSNIKGITRPGAGVRISLTQQGEAYTFPEVTADSGGVFSVTSPKPLEAGAEIKAEGRWHYLSAGDEAQVIGEGRLELLLPGLMEFYTSPLSPNTETVKRLDPEWKLVVSDTRRDGGKWRIYARLGSPLTPDNPERPTLWQAVIYADEENPVRVLDTGENILIMEHTSNPGEDVFPLVWDEDRGILLTIKPGLAFAGTQYRAEILWTLVDGP